MRRGFTLLELLLVLAVLVVVAALAVPAFNYAFDGQKLRKSGDQVRAEWAKARNLSMKSGRIHVFRCKLGLGEYEIRPFYAADDVLESSIIGGNVAQPAAGDSPLSSGPKRLTPGVLFAAGQSEDDTRAAQVNESLGGTGEWSQPILFYSDGTSSTAKMLLTNRKKQFVTLSLRGLTGLSEVSGLLTEQEAMQ